MSIFYEGWQWMLRMLFSIVKKYKNDLNVHKTLGLLFEAVLLMSLTSERRSAMQCGVAWSVARSVAWSVPTQILMQVVICGQLMITTLPTSPVSTNHIIPNIKCTAESQAATYCIVVVAEMKTHWYLKNFQKRNCTLDVISSICKLLQYAFLWLDG